jgi:hypothetical protein
MTRILHLSDLHVDYGSGHHGYAIAGEAARGAIEKSLSLTLADAILRALTRSGQHKGVNAVVVTGDLTWKGDPNGFDYALAQVKQVCQGLGVNISQNLLLIPGNHDANQEAAGKNEAFAGFRAALRKHGLRDTGPECQHAVTLSKSKPRVHLIGVNSALMESKPNAGIGFVGEQVLEDLLAGLSATSEEISVLCMHHHLLPIAHLERAHFHGKHTSVTLDARAVLGFCARHSIGLVLHGHQHQPLLTQYSSLDPLNPIREQSRPVWISSAGSCGVTRRDTGEVGKRHFQLISFDGEPGDTHCEITPYVSSNENSQEFEPCSSVSIRINKHNSYDNQLFCGSAASTAGRIAASGQWPSKSQKSNLYVVFCKVRAGGEAFQFITNKRKIERSNEWAEVIGVHAVFGEYDLVLKIRSSSDKFLKEAYLEEMANKWAVRRSTDDYSWYKYYDIDIEQYADFGGGRSQIRVDKKTRAILAFVQINDERSAAVIAELQEVLKPGPADESGLLMASYIGSRGGVAEIVVPCGGYYRIDDAVSRVTGKLARLLPNPCVTSLAYGSWTSETELVRGADNSQ